MRTSKIKCLCSVNTIVLEHKVCLEHSAFMAKCLVPRMVKKVEVKTIAHVVVIFIIT